jgi:hypothetical protein
MLFKTSLCGLPFITTEIPRYFFSTSIGRAAGYSTSKLIEMDSEKLLADEATS